MKRITLFVPLIVLVLGFNSCETDIDVNAELEDLPVVYAAIDPANTTHYVKINKAFLQDNVSAVDLAGDQANFNYGANELIVEVEELNSSGNVVKTYSLTRTENEIPKDPGIFDASVNVLYKFTEPNINQQSTYRIRIFNTTLKKEITAQTEIVKNLIIIKPNNQSKTSFFAGSPSTGNFIKQTFEVRTGDDIGRVVPTLIFNYTDHFTTASGLDSIPRSVRISLGEKKTTSNVGGETFLFDLSIPMLSHRKLNRLSIEFLVAGTELNTFMEVNEPSNNINQEKPPYTNVINGLGIFSSRANVLFTSLAGQGTIQDINLTPDTMRKLQSLGREFCFGNNPFSGFQCP